MVKIETGEEEQCREAHTKQSEKVITFDLLEKLPRKSRIKDKARMKH